MQLTKNFSLAEMLESSTAHRKGLKEQFNPPASVIACLDKLCKHVLQPLRDHFGQSIEVTSGYRCPALNKAIGGSKTSDHCYGMAADIKLTTDGKNRNQELFDAVVKLNLPFKQMIDEFGTETHPQWIHISFDQTNNKKEKLRARKVNGKTVYSKI